MLAAYGREWVEVDLVTDATERLDQALTACALDVALTEGMDTRIRTVALSEDDVAAVVQAEYGWATQRLVERPRRGLLSLR